MNILIVISDLGLGGAQKVAISLANGLVSKNNIYLYDIAPEVRRQEFIDELSDKVCILKHQVTFFEKIVLKVFYALLSLLPESKKYEKKLTYLEKQWFIKRFVSEKKIDVINTHLWWADKFIAETFGGSLPCPLIISSHGDHRYFSIDNRIPGYSEQLKYVLSKATCITYLSDNFLPMISKLNLSPLPRLVKVIHGFSLDNPIQIPPALTDKKGCTFMVASRATEEKGWKEAIECTLLLQRNGYACNLILAGDGELLAELKAKYPSEKFPFITFLGYISDVISYINLSDVILLPTYDEQLPTFIVEGLFLSKPVIATDVGEIRHMVTYNNELAGILIPLVNRKPDVEALYNAMLELMTNEKRRMECSLTAHKAYEKFDYENFINQYEKLFLALR